MSKNAKKLEVVLGAHNLTDQSENDRKISKVKEIIIQHMWDHKAISFDYDIALIRLNEKVQFDEFISPIEIKSNIGEKEFGKNAGWVKRSEAGDDGTLADVATIAELRTIENDECIEKNRNLTQILGENSFCAKITSQDSCPSDTGSSFYFVDNDGKKYLKGMITLPIGQKCTENEVAVILDITEYDYFIEVKNHLSISILRFQ